MKHRCTVKHIFMVHRTMKTFAHSAQTLHTFSMDGTSVRYDVALQIEQFVLDS